MVILIVTVLKSPMYILRELFVFICSLYSAVGCHTPMFISAKKKINLSSLEGG